MAKNRNTDLALTLAQAWGRLEGSLDASIASARGISFAEYRILRALGDAKEGSLSRVDLANEVGLSPSGVTRAVQPLEKLGAITTVRSNRDARLALTKLTRAGKQMVSDASGVIDDVVDSILIGKKRTAGVEDLVRSLLTRP